MLSGQDSVYVQCTIFPVLNRTIAVFPKSTLQQKRAVPALSLICLSSPRFPAARLRTSLATLRLFLSSTRHCTVLSHAHLLHRSVNLHARASTGNRANASEQRNTEMPSTTAMSSSVLPFRRSFAFKARSSIMPGKKWMGWRGDLNSTPFSRFM